ncbi:MAG TPA: glycerol-3-phosphate 1-O-acyltransferase PlsY [Bryobacteraceae bacterium]|nr:glycerol-3-phosphate 1-O-acyltransferase PlsY [Bryobacteraceae bacterium]
MMPLLSLAAAYLLGAIPFGYLLVKWKTGGDVRASGSGNIGATNVLRTTGRAAGVATLLLDIAKGYLAVWLASQLTQGDALWTALAALAVMAGHAYPIFLKFKGGKAVASFLGAFLFITPVAVGASLLVFVAAVAWTKYISLGSIICTACFPLAVWLLQKPPLPVLLASVLAGTFIIYKHSSNIQRLREGSEHVFRFASPK